MVLLDTNILVYAANKDCEFHEIAVKTRNRVINGELQGCVSLQNLVEFYSVITSPKRIEKPLTPEVSLGEIDKYVKSENILKVGFSETALNILGNLVRKYKITAQDIYDLKIVATMIANQVDTIVTVNEDDFVKYSEIKVINPAKT